MIETRGKLLPFLTIFAVILLLRAGVSTGKEYAIRQVTDFGSSPMGSSPTPIGVINDRLLFSARENDTWGLYRTDGVNVEQIDDTARGWPGDIAQLNNELFFAATGQDGRELHASDGQTLRQVADLAPGILNSSPNSLRVLNGNLLFNAITSDASVPGGAPRRFFRTDGTDVNELHRVPVTPIGFVELGNRLIFAGVPAGGGRATIHSTDGQSIFDIPTPDGNISLLTPITHVDNHAYFVAGDGVDRGVYRTDGLTAERIAPFDSFTHLSTVEHMFVHDGHLVFTMEDRTNDELIFYQTNGELPSEITRWPIPDGINLLPPQFNPQPEISDGTRAYFSFRNGLNEEIYVFDGSAFKLLAGSTGGHLLTGLDGRVFVNEFNLTPRLYEVVNDDLLPLGGALLGMFTFDGDVFWMAR